MKMISKMSLIRMFRLVVANGKLIAMFGGCELRNVSKMALRLSESERAGGHRRPWMLRQLLAHQLDLHAQSRISTRNS